ncbi:hypothetical protein HMPREF0645_0937 [Hallella bergensis DSM 17361]|uniref:Uncharacterized protein n=1 Tax=Hallella bergensis DSM 17361 TaxID=585502 RepID=D1PVF2_9BACT|nr:hypothetical protein [Hallella bergensis]EFA44635.1 hypothetical protein HMPREF0645_0937 [Hallella bergensis DSM 17361]
MEKTKDLSKAEMLMKSPRENPFQPRACRKRLICGQFDKVELHIEIYRAPKPNVLVFLDDLGRWLNFASLEDLFVFLANNYTINI